MLQQRVLRQVDCEMMDNLPLTANETASEMVLLENAHVDCALYVCNPNTPPPPPHSWPDGHEECGQCANVANSQCPMSNGDWQHWQLATLSHLHNHFMSRETQTAPRGPRFSHTQSSTGEGKAINMVRQAKLGRTNRMKGICTAKKTTCR